MRRFLFILTLLCCSVRSSGQQTSVFRDSVLGKFMLLRTGSDSVKVAAAADMERMFLTFYSQSAMFDAQLDSVPFLGQLSSDDGKVRMICWNLVLENGDFRYFCIILFRTDKKNVSLVALHDTDTDWSSMARRRLAPNDWYGALYYRILSNKYRGVTHYTLLGWDGNNAITNRKVIDALEIRGAKVSLGDRIFTADGRPANRLVFEYANDATMSLNYDKQLKMIVMDHLAPEDSRQTGQFQFYGPDFSYDGLKFEKGRWMLKKDIFTTNKGLNNLPKEARPDDFKD